MDPERLPPSPAELAARLDRLEQQVLDLTQQLAKSPPPQFQPPAPPPPDIHESALLPDPVPPFLNTPPPPRASLENRLGSQVFNRIGILALLIGATWFLKLAVDNHWIGPTGRILVGLLAGAGLILWSERFRRSGFAAFSYSLKAIGTGVLYLSLWASFQLYHLLPAPAALACMLLVTAWNAWMAWSQNAELLAAYALAGGLSTPLLLSTGGNHQLFLFTYLLAIDLAAVLLARLRSWPRLLPGALAATAAYFIGWYTHFFSPAQLFLTSLFALLFATTFASGAFPRRHSPADISLRTPDHILIEEVLLPLASASFAAIALYAALRDSGHYDLTPWLMLALSAAYLGLQRLPQPALTAAIHLALAVTFLTIAIPLKASGPWIVIAWLIEGAALLAVATRTHTQVPEDSSLATRALLLLASAALLLGFFGILVELMPYPQNHTAFLNRGFATALVGLASFAASLFLLLRRPAEARTGVIGKQKTLAAALTIAFSLTVIAAGIAQIDLLFADTRANPEASLQAALATSAFLMLYGAILLAVGFWKRSAFIRWQALILLVIAIAKTFLYDMRNLSQGYRVLSFLALGALLMAVSFAYQKDWLALRDSPQHPHQEPNA